MLNSVNWLIKFLHFTLSCVVSSVLTSQAHTPLSVFSFGQMDVDSAATFPSADEKRADDNVENAAPHGLNPAHVDEEELHTRHDQPEIDR